jgi:uncharacterized protein (TIGR02118 family)
MFRFTAVFPASEDCRFDFDYYVKTHIPMVVSLIGPSVVRTEATKGLAGIGGSQAPYAAIGHIYLRDLEGLQAAFQENGARIVGDAPNFTNIEAIVSIEEVVAH